MAWARGLAASASARSGRTSMVAGPGVGGRPTAIRPGRPPPRPGRPACMRPAGDQPLGHGGVALRPGAAAGPGREPLEYVASSRRRTWPSIQPWQSASSQGLVVGEAGGVVVPFLASTNHTPAGSAWWSPSQRLPGGGVGDDQLGEFSHRATRPRRRGRRPPAGRPVRRRPRFAGGAGGPCGPSCRWPVRPNERTPAEYGSAGEPWARAARTRPWPGERRARFSAKSTLSWSTARAMPRSMAAASMRSVAGFEGFEGQMLDVVGDRAGQGQEVGGGRARRGACRRRPPAGGGRPPSRPAGMGPRLRRWAIPKSGAWWWMTSSSIR